MTEKQRDEGWFLEQIEQDNPDTGALFDWLACEAAKGNNEQAGDCSELLLEYLAGLDEPGEALRLVRWRMTGPLAENFPQQQCSREVAAALGRDPAARAMIDAAGFDGEQSRAEAFRRLDVLLALKVGTRCFHPTWGAGEVVAVDWFYRRVNIDFEEKQGHELSYDFAADSLEILPPGHLLSRWLEEGEELRRMAAEDPAGTVRLALKSFGPLSVDELRDILAPRLVAEEQWKTFWDTARTRLKNDEQVVLPGRRKDRLQLVTGDSERIALWLQKLEKAQSPAAILRIAADGLQDMQDNLDAGQSDAVAAKLMFAISGTEDNDPAREAFAILLLANCDNKLDDSEWQRRLERFLRADRFVATLSGLGARDCKAWLKLLSARLGSQRVVPLICDSLEAIAGPPFNETVAMLEEEEGQDDEVRRLFRGWADAQCLQPEVVEWLVRNFRRCEQWGIANRNDLTRWALRVLAEDAGGERLKTRNQLRRRLEQPAWLKPLLAVQSVSEKRQMIREIKSNPAWGVMDKRSLLARLVKLDPELAKDVADRRDVDTERRTDPRTSYRAYLERQEQLLNISQVELPRVAREIGVARSHGDLRENFEYKSAKDKQALLLRRKAELESMLARVRPTDFARVSADRVVPGTRVRLEWEEGGTADFCILGVWDRDEELGIISSESAMGRALAGARVGDVRDLPGENGARKARIVTVDPVPDKVRQWIDHK